MEVLEIMGNLGIHILLTQNLQNPIIFVYSFTKSGWQADSSNSGYSVHRTAFGDPLSCTPRNSDLKEKGFFP